MSNTNEKKFDKSNKTKVKFAILRKNAKERKISAKLN